MLVSNSWFLSEYPGKATYRGITGVIKFPILKGSNNVSHFEGIKQCKSMIILVDFLYNSALFGLVIRGGGKRSIPINFCDSTTFHVPTRSQGRIWWSAWPQRIGACNIIFGRCWVMKMWFQRKSHDVVVFSISAMKFSMSTMKWTVGKEDLGGGNSKIFYFHPENWGRWTHFDQYFSDGLKPPTRWCCSFFPITTMKFL